MFNKKEQKDPVCGMIIKDKFILKHNEKFCSDSCVKEYEKRNGITQGNNPEEKKIKS